MFIIKHQETNNRTVPFIYMISIQIQFTPKEAAVIKNDSGDRILSAAFFQALGLVRRHNAAGNDKLDAFFNPHIKFNHIFARHKIRKPEVGFGVVGINTLTISRPRISRTSPSVSALTKPKIQIPLRGYSNSTTFLNALLLPERKVSKICFKSE